MQALQMRGGQIKAQDTPISIPLLRSNEKWIAQRGSRLKDEDAAIIGAELIRIRNNCVVVTTELIVSEAQNENNALHKFFTWDDTEAAQKWRRNQARYLMQNILIVTIPTSGNIVREKAIFSLQTHSVIHGLDKTERAYYPISEVKTNSELVDAVRRDAWKELQSWVRKYRNFGFVEFDTVFRFYDEHAK